MSELIVACYRAGDLDRDLGVGGGPQRARLARRRTLEAALEPIADMRRRREVHVDGAADNGCHVEICDGEVVADQIAAAGERAVEHLELRLDHLERLGATLRIAV